uniref:Uncharacterized protein LOC114348239 n=1 Tax=Diabrotica virgifera virgifera TaxID=50390 RepID=A0A6P7HFZ6_DIAVI
MFPNRLLLSVFKSSKCTISKVPQINNGFRFAVNIQNARPLYSKVTLGIDMFLQQCQTTGKQMENISEKFKEKMFEFSQDEGKHMVFTEDLKNMIHLSKDEKDLDLVVKMIKK